MIKAVNNAHCCGLRDIQTVHVRPLGIHFCSHGAPRAVPYLNSMPGYGFAATASSHERTPLSRENVARAAAQQLSKGRTCLSLRLPELGLINVACPALNGLGSLG